MARKANISREEIILACWSLLEQNYFPNIPRLTDYFLKLDGRKCSNTTFLKAITEWEELYKESQEASFKDLSDVFKPSFKRLERDIAKDLQGLLEEKLFHAETSHALKRDATNGQYLSLTQTVEAQLDEINTKTDLIESLQQSDNEKSNRIEYLEQRYQDTLTSLKVKQTQLDELEQQFKEVSLNLAQKEVDLAKSETQFQVLQSDRDKLLVQLESKNTIIDELQTSKHTEIEGLVDEVKRLISLQTPKDKPAR